MITSLHSPHVEVVKALLGSRGVKERRERGQYVIEGEQNLLSALESAPEQVETIYFTAEGISRIGSVPADMELIEVSPQVMAAMSDTVSSQGILAIASINNVSLQEAALKNPRRIAYFWQIQDPGNAGTVIRAATAFGFDLVIFSDSSVDVYSPKVVRSTAGAFWQIPVIQGCAVSELNAFAKSLGARLLLTKGDGEVELATGAQSVRDERAIWVFGNEARGLPEDVAIQLKGSSVRIPMAGPTESLNLATAAAVVMYEASRN